MRTARSSSRRGGGLHQAPPRTWHPPGAGTPSVNRITGTCKNITFPQLRLRAVIRKGLAMDK